MRGRQPVAWFLVLVYVVSVALSSRGLGVNTDRSDPGGQEKRLSAFDRESAAAWAAIDPPPTGVQERPTQTPPGGPSFASSAPTHLHYATVTLLSSAGHQADASTLLALHCLLSV